VSGSTVAQTGFENVDLSAAVSGSSTIAITAATMGSQIAGSTQVETITGGLGNDSIYGYQGTDVIDGGAGNDTLYIINNASSSSSPFAHNNITGATTGTIGNTNLVNVENVVISGNANGTTTVDLSAQTEAFVISAAGVAVGYTTTTGAGATNTPALAITGGGGADTITGSSLVDTIVGGAGADVISASSGADNITGGAGADVLTGGAGADTFVFTTVTDSNEAGGIDRITDLVLDGATGDLLDFTLTGTLTVKSVSLSTTAKAAADTVAEITALFNSTNGTAGATNLFTGPTAGVANATALLVTMSDGTLMVVDVDGNGTFSAADVVIDVTGVTATSFGTGNFI